MERDELRDHEHRTLSHSSCERLTTAHPSSASSDTPASNLFMVRRRVVAYLHALGLRDENRVDEIAARVVTRLAQRRDEEPLYVAIEETQALIDRWLAAALDLDEPRTGQSIASARLALGLSDLPHARPNAFANPAGIPPEVTDTLLNACPPSATPPPVEQAMDMQPIDLYSTDDVVKHGSLFFGAVVGVVAALLTILPRR